MMLNKKKDMKNLIIKDLELMLKLVANEEAMINYYNMIIEKLKLVNSDKEAEDVIWKELFYEDEDGREMFEDYINSFR